MVYWKTQKTQWVLKKAKKAMDKVKVKDKVRVRVRVVPPYPPTANRSGSGGSV